MSLERASRLAGDDAVTRSRIDEAGAHAAALAGEVDRALELCGAVLAAPGEVLDGARQGALSLVLARAALQAGRWASAKENADDASRLGEDAGHEAVVAAARAVAAQAAMGEGRVGDAVGLAHTALELGRHAAAPAS